MLIPENIAVLASLIIAIIALALVILTQLRLKKLLQGTDKRSLEDGIKEVQKIGEDYNTFKAATDKSLATIEKKLSGSIRAVATVRFDAFEGGHAGGGQSFATAYLNEQKDGVVLSSIHTRDRASVFAKPLKNGTSEYELTPEEKSAIEEAAKNLK